MFSLWPSLEPLCVCAGTCDICHVNRLYRKQIFPHTTPRFKNDANFLPPITTFHYLPMSIILFGTQAGSNDDRLHSVSCIANTVFTLQEIRTIYMRCFMMDYYAFIYTES